jgi:hypothetical protein
LRGYDLGTLAMSEFTMHRFLFCLPSILFLVSAPAPETYRFRGDGTSLVTSRQEVSESEYRVHPQPDAKGFYVLDDRVVKNNGKQDCTGETVRIGAAVRNYLRFHPSGDMFLMCFQETMGSCIGPFRRVRGAGT